MTNLYNLVKDLASEEYSTCPLSPTYLSENYLSDVDVFNKGCIRVTIANKKSYGFCVEFHDDDVTLCYTLTFIKLQEGSVFEFKLLCLLLQIEPTLRS